MQTPPPPLLSRQAKASERTTSKTPFSGIPKKSPERTTKTPFTALREKAPERTTKTPFQNHQSYARHFESEFQPNRVSSRFQLGNRFCNTGHRTVGSNQESQNPKSLLVSRLQKNLLPQTKKPEIIKDIKPIASSIPEIKRQPAPVTTTSVAASFRVQPKTPGAGNLSHKRVNPEHDHHISKQTQLHVQPTQQQLLHKTQTQHQNPQQLLLQQTGPNQQVGPLATATKPPLSVSQYTQPTPLPTNRSTHQISRAHSESSIKYQVQVNDKTYKILRKIGAGGSAKVYEGFESQTSQTVAIKIINIAKADARTQESYFNEKLILKKLRDSRHVVRMYDCEYKAECKELVIVMEKGDADLSLVIDSYFKNKTSAIDGLFIKYYWRGMVQAVDSIHQHGIVHADLKPVNFILVKNEIKLIDFGIASAVDPEGTSIIRDYQIGTINYMAPESLRNRALDASIQHLLNDVDENNQQQKRTVIKYNSKADIWSLGCILYNLVYGRPPFDEYKDVLSKVQAITNPRHVINFPKISNQNLLNCMRSCLRYNPADRPTAQDLLNDPYLKEDIVMLQNA